MEYFFAGEDIDNDIAAAIEKYGAQAVKESVRRQTLKKRGRHKVQDWPALMPYIEADALQWLQTGKFNGKSSTSIANEIANLAPEHTRPTVHRRTMDRLSKEREYRTAIAAFCLSKKEGPFFKHINALTWLRNFEDWREVADGNLQIIAMRVSMFEKINGHFPDENMPLSELEAEASKANPDLNAFMKNFGLSTIEVGMPGSILGENLLAAHARLQKGGGENEK